MLNLKWKSINHYRNSTKQQGDYIMKQPLLENGGVLLDPKDGISPEELSETYLAPHILPKEVSDVDIAFGGRAMELLPLMDEIPDEFQKDSNQYNRFISKIFYNGSKGLEVIPHPGIDTKMAFRHLAAILKSYEPKHEHKIAGCAYLSSLWFTEIGTVKN